jgi:hypothetical protein
VPRKVIVPTYDVPKILLAARGFQRTQQIQQLGHDALQTFRLQYPYSAPFGALPYSAPRRWRKPFFVCFHTLRLGAP